MRRTGRRANRHDALVVILAIAGLIVGCVLSIVLGARPTPPGAAVAAFLAGPAGDGDPELIRVIWGLRIPRTVLAIVTGGALAVAGALAQAWTRNPLADPGIIGITAGSGFAVAVGATLGIVGTGQKAGLALVGAGVVAVVVLVVSRISDDPLTLLLVGVGMAATLTAGTTLMALHDSSVLDGMRQWTVGSTVGRDVDDLAIAVSGLVLGLVPAVAVARPMDLWVMGEETAVGLGGSPIATRTLTALAVVILAGSATAAVGPIAFVGFAAPHIVRRFTGPTLTRMLTPVLLTGAVVTLVADVLGRVIARPGEVEVSVVLSVIGAPLLIAAVARPHQRARKGLT